MSKKKRIVIALGGNALGNTLPEQMAAVKITARAIVDLIEEGCEVVVAHGNGPQVGMINNAMLALTHEDEKQPNTPLSVCVAMSQAYIGYDLQNALREELLNRGITDIPVATMITNDPAFKNPSKPIGRFLTKEQADEMAEKYNYIMKEDAGRGYRRVVASPKPQEIVEIGTIRNMVNAGELVIACGGGGIPVTLQGNHLKGASAVIDKDFASCLMAKNLDADFLIILTAVEKVAVNYGKPDEKWIDHMTVEEAKQYMEEHSKRPYVVYEADEDAEYDAEYTIDLSTLKPTVSFPHLPENTRTIDEVGDVKIDQVVIGSCTNGRMDDLRIAASVLKGKKVKKGLRVIVIPATQKIYLQAMEEGLLRTFIEAGAVVSTPTCGPCLGGYMGILAAGERCVSTTNRNFVGRMGHVDSEVYLASPAVAAASAVTGKISSPEEVM